MDGSSHIEFVSNHNGSTASDIILSTLPAPLSVALTSVVLPFLLPIRYALLQYSSRIWIHLLIETVTVVCPLLLSLTILSSNSSMNLVCLMFVIVCLMLYAPKWWNGNIPSLKYLFDLPLPEKRPPFLTNYRAGMNFATAICILAVDFQVFPRRFAKTETYGYGLMDVGVGSFVIAHGLAGSSQNHIKTLKKTIPLLILGFFRLLTVKLSNYHEHVTEYGVHWNFFFTLAFIRAASALITVNYRPAVISLSLLAVHEFALKLGLENWILSDYPRIGLLSANREGIFSLLGYTALFYAACELGDFIGRPKKRFYDWLEMLKMLILLAIIGWIALQISEFIFGSPSRRLANLSFCIWMLTYNTVIMAAYLLVDLFLVTFDARRDITTDTQDDVCLPVFREPYLLRCINYNGLAFFLLANLLTGIVNMIFDTIHMGNVASLVILFVYCSVLCLTMASMYLWRLRVG